MITTYECEYCHNQSGNGYREPETCLRHETECDYNPAMKTCATCDLNRFKPTENGRAYPFWCEIFRDRKHRRNCEKWVHNKPAANPPNIPSSATPQAGLEPRKRNGGEQ